MVYVTILEIDKKEQPELCAQVLATCQYCVTNDKTKTFTFKELPDGGIEISNPLGRNQAFHRGAYFHKKHNLSYEVFWANDQT